MISYKDKTWCDAHECSKFEVCDRAYTQKEKERAIKWWGQPNPPVGFYLNPQVLECYAPTQPEMAPDQSNPNDNTTILRDNLSQTVKQLSFRELAKRHGLKPLSEAQYRMNVKMAVRHARRSA